MRKLVIVTTLIATMVGALPAGAHESGERPVHLALGDSVAFGIGVERPDLHGYSAVLSRWAQGIDCRQDPRSGCPHLELTNMAVPGATSSTFIVQQLPDAVGLITDRNRDADPDNDVEFITITIGGNDFFGPVVAACADGLTQNCADVVEGALTTYAANLGLILGTLRAAAGPDTRVVIMTYYNPLPACNLSDLAPLADLVLEGGGPVPTGINDIIKATAAATGVEVSNTFGRLDNNDFVGGTDCLHPDKSGHHKIARIFERTLR